MSELAKPTLDRAIEAINTGDIEEARRLLRIKQTEHVPVHDGYMHWVAGMLTFISDNYGTENVNNALTYTQTTMWEPLFDYFDNLDLKTRAETICSLWHWHCTTFTISEDDEKFTFMLDPCGSGMRLEKAGAYDGPHAYARVKEEHPMTFAKADFPVYCSHCAVNNKVQLANRLPLFIVEGWRTSERKKGLCIQYTYKHLNAVPDEHFERIGLQRVSSDETAIEQNGRLFSDAELRELATPPMERAIKALDEGRSDAAMQLCEDERQGWPGLQSQYRDWVSLLLIFIRDNFGEDTYRRAFEDTLHCMLNVIYADVLSEKNLEQAAERLAGVWLAFGEPVDIFEDDAAFTFTVTPAQIFSPRFTDKLTTASNDFCRIHNHIVEQWSAERDWASSSFIPQLSFSQSADKHDAQVYQQCIQKQLADS